MKGVFGKFAIFGADIFSFGFSKDRFNFWRKKCFFFCFDFMIFYFYSFLKDKILEIGSLYFCIVWFFCILKKELLNF